MHNNGFVRVTAGVVGVAAVSFAGGSVAHGEGDTADHVDVTFLDRQFGGFVNTLDGVLAPTAIELGAEALVVAG